MRVLLVRHARAGDRGEWVGDDAHRPLDAKGRKQAKRLAKRVDLVIDVDGGEIRPVTYLPPA